MVDSPRERCGWALDALCHQSALDRMEILLLDFGTPDALPVRWSSHPAVRLVRADASAGYGAALASAVADARAPIVAFVEEHVIVLDGWAQALIEAHEGPWAAVCGEILPGDLDRAVSRRIELVSRHHWSAPATRGESAVLRWQNVSYKRATLVAFGDALPTLLSAESVLFRRLRQNGARLFVEPRARMVHAHEHRWLGFLIGSFHSARLSAASAAALDDTGIFGRLALSARCMVGAARWPWVLWRRTASLPQADIWLREFRRSLPFVFQYYVVHALAGSLGALSGTGGSSRREPVRNFVCGV
jgi:GT2 family glycosyltransferase